MTHLLRDRVSGCARSTPPQIHPNTHRNVLIEAMKDQKVSETMGLNQESVILLFGTEGATDPEIYNSIITE